MKIKIKLMLSILACTSKEEVTFNRCHSECRMISPLSCQSTSWRVCRFESAVTSGVVPSQSRAVISPLSLAASVWVLSKRHLFPGNQESKGIKEQICMSLTVLAISTSENKLTMTRASEFPKPRKPKSLLSNAFSNSHGLISDRTQYLKEEKKIKYAMHKTNVVPSVPR